MDRYRKENKERISEVCRVYQRKWVAANLEHVREKARETAKRQRIRHKEKLNAKWRLYYQNGFNLRKRYMNEALKLEIMSAYGPGGQPKCTHCLISDIDVLTVDHINNDGADERKKLKISGAYFYKHLRSRGYPSGYQTLCMNCNLKKEINHRRGKMKLVFAGQAA